MNILLLPWEYNTNSLSTHYGRSSIYNGKKLEFVALFRDGYFKYRFSICGYGFHTFSIPTDYYDLNKAKEYTDNYILSLCVPEHKFEFISDERAHKLESLL